MLVVNRFDVAGSSGASFEAEAQAAMAVLSARPGHRGSRLGRAVDDPATWVLVTEWDDVGSYRRALSSYEVKVAATPLLARARQEPSAFEVLRSEGAGAEPPRSSDRAGGRTG